MKEGPSKTAETILIFGPVCVLRFALTKLLSQSLSSTVGSVITVSNNKDQRTNPHEVSKWLPQGNTQESNTMACDSTDTTNTSSVLGILEKYQPTVVVYAGEWFESGEPVDESLLRMNEASICCLVQALCLWEEIQNKKKLLAVHRLLLPIFYPTSPLVQQSTKTVLCVVSGCTVPSSVMWIGGEIFGPFVSSPLTKIIWKTITLDCIPSLKENQSRSFVYIEDIVAPILDALKEQSKSNERELNTHQCTYTSMRQIVCDCLQQRETGKQGTTDKTIEVKINKTVEWFLNNMEEPTVSAIIATYDSEERKEMLLNRCLPSVLSQSSLPSGIFICVDSSSTYTKDLKEPILAVAKSYGFPLEKVHVVQNSRTDGASGAWNTAVVCAMGHAQLFSGASVLSLSSHFLAFVDDDDCWMEDHLQLCLQATRKKPSDLVISGFQRITTEPSFKETTQQDQKVRVVIPKAEDMNVRNFLMGNKGVQGSNLFINANGFTRAGMFDENLLSCTDRDLMVRVLDLPGIKISCTSTVSVLHYADQNRSRLSSPASPAKTLGLNTFYYKYVDWMSENEVKRACERAKDYFNWHPPTPKTDTVRFTSLALPQLL